MCELIIRTRVRTVNENPTIIAHCFSRLCGIMNCYGADRHFSLKFSGFCGDRLIILLVNETVTDLILNYNLLTKVDN